MSGCVGFANKQAWIYRTAAFEIVLSEVLKYVDRSAAPVAHARIEETIEGMRFLSFWRLPFAEQHHLTAAARKAADTIADSLGDHLKEDPEIVKTYVRITEELADQMAESLRWSEAQASNAR